MQTPVINTKLNAFSRAHPLPFRPSPREQQIRALVARVPISVNLRGLSFGRTSTVADSLTPKVRRAPFNQDVNPKFLDVVECWKGLSHTQAMELAMWYQFLHVCLHNEVQEALSKDLVEDLLGDSEAIEEVNVFAHMLKCLRSKPKRIIDISFVDVIDSMMGMFHDRFPNESASLASSWSHFSGGLSLFLHKFLSLQDCFYHSAEGPCLEASFDFQFADWTLTATGDVAWQPPPIRFLHVPTTRAGGETYRITPFVWKEVESPIRSPGCDDYVEHVEYTITRSPAKFSWDPAKRCFNSVVGHVRDGKPHTVETLIMATVTTPFPDRNVQFEKRARWSMKLDVTPALQPPIPKRSSYEAALRHRLRPSTVASENGTVVHFVPADTLCPAYPQKRKVSNPEFVDADAASKRRRHDSMFAITARLGDEGASVDDSLESHILAEVRQIAELEQLRASFDPRSPQGS